MTKREKPYLGHAVSDGKIRFTSISQVKLFDPDSDGCPRKWAYSYRFGKKLKRTGSQVKGSEHAEAMEQYLTTGEDVLTPVLRPIQKYLPVPGKDLECEQSLGDIERAIKLREEILKADALDGFWREGLPEYKIALREEMKEVAGLVAAGVPMDGAADVRHRRGEFIDSDGILKREDPGMVVTEIGDLKTASRIFPQKIKSGPNAGTIIPAYTKTDAEVCEDLQMVTYGVHEINRHPEITHVRLSHYYANTKKREGAKRTGLVTVETLLRRFERVEARVVEMIDVARAEKIEDVDPHVKSCDSYTHVDPNDPTGTKILKGCGHRYYCPLSIHQTAHLLVGTHKESAMSLFDTLPSSAPAAPPAALPPPVATAAEHEAAVAAARALLLAEEKPASSIASPQLLALVERGDLRDAGNGQAFVKEGADTGWVLKPMQADWRAAIDAHAAGARLTPPPALTTPPPSPIAVAPADQPKTTSMLEMAGPVPPQAVAEITDPELRARVEQHNHQHGQRALEDAALKEAEKIANGGVVWCPGGNQKIVVTTEMGLNGYSCACGKHWSTKTLKPIKEDGHYTTIVPRHKPTKDAGKESQGAAPPAPPPTISIVVAPPPPPPVQVAAAPPPPVSGNGHALQATQYYVFAVVTVDGRGLALNAPSIQDALGVAQKIGDVKSIEMLGKLIQV